MSTQQYKAATSRTTGISSASINNGAGALGSEIDFSSARELYLNLRLTFSCASAPASGAPWYVYLLTDAVGSGTYEDGGASVQPAGVPDAIINARPVTGSQIVEESGVRIKAPLKTKILLWNATGQNATSVTLLAWSHSEESV